MSLRRATAVSQPEVLSVALASQLQPILKYLLDGKEKAPIDHEIFSVLGSALHALPEYFRLQACVDDDGAICGPTDDSSLARATKFKLSDTFIKALKCGDWVSVLDGAVHEYRNWHAAFKVACPSITDVVHDLHQNPDMIVFLDHIFSSVGYPRQRRLPSPVCGRRCLCSLHWRCSCARLLSYPPRPSHWSPQRR